ncbi:two-component system LytT family sensor kinase [Neomicrococcus aestuarii]|uniref:Two-component system LytT family sensor kinase n=1 Tax=Neomicrococcus aestuarii TaxID=556325 RepID=A0A7W8WZ88_9MICC|nr:histidine kinase [Neomicrococcus aestuarii]MBB5511563.1 two-component system LytT family sensor kinase [Neomicrococcus aestuarii]
MPESAFQTILLTSVVAIAVALVFLVGYHWVKSQRDLGTDADRATFETLHIVSLAAPYFRAGLTREGSSKAVKHLRTLLGSRGVAITDAARVLATDGDFPVGVRSEGDSTDAALFGLAQKTLEGGRTRVIRKGDYDAVCAPIQIQDRLVGTVIAVTDRADPGLVRAVTETAAWVASQIAVAELNESRAKLTEAELKALRAQISPHFIYNSLNAIASFIITDPDRARDLVVEFADFTRYSFRRHGDFTTFKEELEAIHRYLLLEQARFGERIKVKLAIAPEVLPIVIPFLSIQPLVENAVRHGLEKKPEGGTVIITAHDVGEFAEISIEDDGVGMDPGSLKATLAGTTEGIHVGLRNVDVRLRQIYGPQHGLVVETAPGHGTLITLRIPKFHPEATPALT